ncbi:MAG: MFS transporter [Chloroflexota bacterium]|nr:MFS transporter [Chloroflexota bacterium]
MKSDAPRGDRRPFLSLMAANAVSQVGNMMTAVAVPWFVLETTGSAAQVGLVSAALAIGAVLPSILGGPLVDRIGLRRTSVSADVLSALTVLLIPVLHLAGVLQFWMLLVLAFALASVNSVGDAGRMALLPRLAQRAHLAPERANSTDRAVARLGQLFGPVVAGVLIALIGPTNVLFADVATFAISAVVVAAGIPQRIERERDAAAGATRAYGAELVEGLRFVVGNRLILSMVILVTIGNFLDVPLIQVVLPVYAREVFDSPAVLGLLMGSLAGGALMGTIIFGVVGKRLPRRLTLLTSWVLVAALVYGALALQLPLPVLLVTAVLGGFIAGPINPILLTVVQRETPPELMGRVFGALNAFAQAGIPFGAATIGLLIDGAGLIPTIAGMGSLYVLTVAVMFVIPALRRMDDVVPAATLDEPAPEAEPALQARLCPTMKGGL